MTKPYIFIDSNHLAWRSFYLLGKKVGIGQGYAVSNAICYGFVNSISHLTSMFENKNVICVWDSPPYWRHDIYKDYKGTRAAKEDSFTAAMILCKEMLKDLRIPQIIISGFEADDLAGIFSHLLDKQKESSIIVTDDMDYFQLLRKRVKIYRPGVGELFTVEKYKSKYPGLKPKDIIMMKAIAGDKSDNIIGVDGVGEKTVMKFLPKYKTLKKILKNQEEIEVIRGCKKIFDEETLDRIRLNKTLVRIPNSDKDIDRHIKQGHVSRKKLDKIFERIGKRKSIKRKKLIKILGEYGLRKYKTKIIKGDNLLGLEII